MSTHDPQLEKLERASDEVVAPTVTATALEAGETEQASCRPIVKAPLQPVTHWYSLINSLAKSPYAHRVFVARCHRRMDTIVDKALRCRVESMRRITGHMMAVSK